MAVGGLGTNNSLDPQSYIKNLMSKPSHTLEDGLVVSNVGAYGKFVYLVNAKKKVFSVPAGQQHHERYANAVQRAKDIVTCLTSRTASFLPSTSGLASVRPAANVSRVGFNPQQYLQNKVRLPNHKIEDNLVVSESNHGKYVYLVNVENKVFSVDIGREQRAEYAEDVRRTKDLVQRAVSRQAAMPLESGIASAHTSISGQFASMSIVSAEGLTAQNKVVAVEGKAKLVKDDDIFSFIEILNTPHVLVNAANNRMEHSGGIAGAIARQAGPEITRECAEELKKGAVSAGQVLWTKAYELNNRYKTSAVAHAVGPNVNRSSPYSPEPQMDSRRQHELLVQCYSKTVIEGGMTDSKTPVVFPPLSAFSFGVDMDISINAFKEGVKKAEYSLQLMGFECPDVYLVLAEKYDSSSAISKAEKAFLSLDTGSSRTPSPQNIPGPSWRVPDTQDHSRRSQQPVHAEPHQAVAGGSDRVVFDDDVPAEIEEEFKKLVDDGIFFLTPAETIKEIPDENIDPVTQSPLNSYKEGEVVSYFANNYPQCTLVSSVLNILRREGQFKCPVTKRVVISGFTNDLENHLPLDSDWLDY